MLASQQIEALTWDAREVVREIDDRPHLLVRITIRRAYFPHRAAVPFLRIRDARQQVADAWFAEVDDDNTALAGYFPTDLPESGVIEFGYGDQTIGRVPLEFRTDRVRRLDHERLPESIVPVTRRYLRERVGTQG